MVKNHTYSKPRYMNLRFPKVQQILICLVGTFLSSIKLKISEECYIDICQLLCPYVQVNAVQTTGEHFPRAVSPGSGGRFLMPLRHFVAAPLLYLYTYKWLATTYTYTLYSLSIYPKKLTWPSGENLARILTVARDQPLPNILPHGNLRFSLLLLSSELLRRLLI